MTCLKALRDAAAVEVVPDKHYMLRSAADLLASALDRLCKDPTVENMIDARGAWAYAARVLSAATPQVPPSPPHTNTQTQRRAA